MRQPKDIKVEEDFTCRKPTPNSKKTRKKVDWQLVKRLSIIQCTLAEICAVLEMSHFTFDQHTNREFGLEGMELVTLWSMTGKASLRRKQWLLADNNASMAIHLGKTYLGQLEEYNVNHAGEMSQEIVFYGNKKPEKWVNEADEDSD